MSQQLILKVSMKKNKGLLKGTHIFKADDLVIDELNKFSNLISSSNEYKHSYPHSWRSKAPLIFRATSQWFISMDEE